MIRDIIRFFREDKITTMILIFVIAVFAFISLKSSEQEDIRKDYTHSQAVDDFRSAEERFKQKVEEAGSMDAYFKDRPVLGMVLNSIFLILFVAFGVGIVINFMWVFRPDFRRKFVLAVPPGMTDWRFSMLFKVVLYFIFGSILLSMFFALLQKIPFLYVSRNASLLLHTTIADFMALGLILLVVYQVRGNPSDLGFRVLEKDAWREAKVGWVAYVAILPLFFLMLAVLLAISHLFSYEPPAHPLVTVFLEEEKASTLLVGYSIFLAVVIGPVLEEVFFRGFCYPVLKKKVGLVWGMVLTSAFFALTHENTFAFFPIFILGMGLAYIYEIRGSLVAPMILHVTHNLIFITYFFLAKKVVLQEAG